MMVMGGGAQERCTMFTRQQLNDRLPDLLANVVQVEVQRFEQFDFATQESEESIEVHRASMASSVDLMKFWVSSVVAQDWSRRDGFLRPYLLRTECRPLSEAAFNRVVRNRSAGLLRTLPLPLHPPTGFVGALQMDDNWNSVSVVAAYEDEYVAFYWSTGA